MPFFVPQANIVFSNAFPIKYYVFFSFFQWDLSYNAYEKDITIVNIFFGDSTVFGELFVVNIKV